MVFGTPLPLYLWAAFYNIMCLVVIMLEERFHLMAPRKFVKMAFIWLMYYMSRIIHGESAI